MEEQQYISLCKYLIEQKLYPERKNGQLSQREFNDLSAQIEEASGIMLSLSTLKRLWKNDVKQPHPSTLDALVSVLGYCNWREFKQAKESSKNFNKPVVADRKNLLKHLPAFAISALLLSIAFIYFSFVRENTNTSRVEINGAVNFKTNKTVSKGVPNTVVFTYDLSQVSADSFFIQQSWDNRHKEPIAKEGNHLSLIYYYPGYHKAKLIANDSILQIRPIHITTNGWLPFAFHGYYPSIPKYIQGEIKHDGIMQVDATQLIQAGMKTSESFSIQVSNIRSFKSLRSTDYFFKSRLKLTKKEAAVCPIIEMRVLCEKHIFYIEFTEPGCVANIQHKLGERIFNSKFNDFTDFGILPEEWIDVNLLVKDKNVVITKNEKEIMRTTFTKDLGEIKGIGFSFIDAFGTVASVELGEIDGTIVYSDDFEQ